MKDVDIYIASDSRQPKECYRWTGYSIQAKTGSGKIKESTGAMSIFGTAQGTTIVVIIEALERFIRPARITIYTDNSSVNGNVKRFKRKDRDTPVSNLELWQENGWKTSRKTEVANRKDWQRLYNKLRVFEHSGGTFEFEKIDEQNRERILQLIKSEKEQDI